ncbi:IS630 family transposase, partial [Parashewanella spongiae]
LIQNSTGKECSLGTVKRTIKNFNYSHKRMRHSLKKQRNEVYFERAYDELVSCVEMEKEGVIDLYYFDESGFSQKSNLPYGWSEKGVAIECTVYQNSKKLNVLWNYHHNK